MESWKIGVIAAMFAGLVGYGLYNENASTAKPSSPGLSILPSGTPKPVHYTGSSILTNKLPEWSNIKQWANTSSPITLSSLKGKVALIEVFRTGCSHCEEAAPFIEALYERYKPRGLQIVALQSPGNFEDSENPENKWEDVQAWLKQKGVKYPVGFDTKSAWFQGKVPGDKLYPTFMLTNKEGKIEYSQTGFDQDKAIFLTIALEKALPNSKPVEQRASELVDWFAQMFQWTGINDESKKELTEDLIKRLS